MTTLELRGISVGQLADVLKRNAGRPDQRQILLTTTRNGNVLHFHDECIHATHLSRPCFQCKGDKP